MAERLAELASLQDRNNAIFSPERMLEHLAQIPEPASPNKRAALAARRGRASLLAGRTERAILEFERARSIVAESPHAFRLEFRDGLLSWLAISYLRLGEQANCIRDHSADSCILPLQGDGIHRAALGARKAMELYLEQLAQQPEDLQARWLLNIAAMALNQYPHGIPERWRVPESLFAVESSVPRFRDVAAQLGLESRGLSGGVVMDDFDRDGDLDLLSSSWGLKDQLRLWLNQGDGRMLEQTKEWGLQGITGGLNLVHADYDNDGYLDVLLLRGAWLNNFGRHPNSLLRNVAGKGFRDVSEEAGVVDAVPTSTAAWGDFDNDGLLDLFVGVESSGAVRESSRLYRNMGSGRFVDVAASANVDVREYVKAAVWGDYDNDGRIDLYLSMLTAPNRLMHNRGPDKEGRWRFENVAAQLGVSEPLNSFPAWFWDFDNDGWQDLFVSGYPADIMRNQGTGSVADMLGLPSREPRLHLYRNLEGRGFEDVSEAMGLNQVILGMGANFGDIDNDGFPDLYLGTGAPDLRAVVPNRLFRNRNGKAFVDVTASARLGHIQKGHGIAFGDIDNDGDQDIYADLGGAFSGDIYQNALFLNPGTDKHWITLQLEGSDANRAAVGARIKLKLDGPGGEREVHSVVSSGGSFGASSLQQEIGLGDADRILELEILWPGSGTVQRFKNLGVDRFVCLKEGSDQPIEREMRSISLGDIAP